MKYELFSSAVVLSVLLLVAGLVVFSPAANNPSGLCQSEMGRIRGWACEKCKADWVTVTQQYGGIECEHGPEHDPNDCAPPNTINGDTDCWEHNGHKANPNDPDPTKGDGICRCYECKPDNWGGACEGDIRFWLAWCGMESQTNCGKCEIEGGGANDYVRQESTAHVVGGGGCNYGDNSDFRVRPDCGRNGSVAYACLSTNCATDGNWGNVGAKEARQKCK